MSERASAEPRSYHVTRRIRTVDATTEDVKASVAVVDPRHNLALASDAEPPTPQVRRSAVAPAATGADELDTIAVALTIAAGAATDRLAVTVRALRPDSTIDGATVSALHGDVRLLHAAVEHLRALHSEGDLVARPAPELLDAGAIARDVAEELQAEGLHVQVEASAEGLVFPGHAPEVRRILRWMIERASSADAAPWIRVNIIASDGSVAFELPWPEDDASTTSSAEREWLVHLIHEQAGTLSTRGFRARVAFPLEAEARDVLRDPDALAREIAALREQRSAQMRDSSAVLAQLRATQAELSVARAHATRLESTLRAAALDMQRMFEGIGGAAAALAERDAGASELQAGVQSALDRVVALLRETDTRAPDPIESGVRPRVHSEEPDPIGALSSFDAEPSRSPASVHARTLPPSAGDPDEAEIPLAEAPLGEHI